MCFTGVAAHVRRESVGSKLMIRFERINLSGVSVSVKPFCASGNFDASNAQVAFWVNCVLCCRGLTRDSLFIDEAILFYTLG